MNVKSNSCGARRPGRYSRFGSVVALLCAVGILTACQTQRQMVSQHEDYLAAAGFIVRPANTSARETMLERLPPHRFVRRSKGEDVYYVYADPLVCDCLYVGTQKAYDQYRRDRLARHLADEEELTAESYYDSSWSWAAWGPGFADGPDFGW